MATINANATTNTVGKTLKLTVQAQDNVIKWVRGALLANKTDRSFVNKMDAIDIAYARYKETENNSFKNGVDTRGAAGCGNVFTEDDITPPIVVSQVDSYVAYLADVFLSGTPMFPVVSNPSNRKYAEQLETLMDDHAALGGYARQFLMFLRDAVKYNYAAIEAPWESVTQFNVAGDFTNGTGKQVSRAKKYYTAAKRLNPRNVIRDLSVDPGDISEKGDYAGYVELISKMKMKRLLNTLTDEGKVYNADLAMMAMNIDGVTSTANYTQNPIISKFVNSHIGEGGNVNWDNWFQPDGKGPRVGNYGSNYEIVTIYGRILPSDFGITAPQPKTPQIWKFRVVNNNILISAERIVSAYDIIPILFGQPLEDGFGYQTQTTAESQISFQEGAGILYNIRFAAARRAVSDRALYDSSMISASDVNSKGPAPKIPVRLSALGSKKLGDAYHNIPFDSRGLETVMQDAQVIAGFGKELSGLSNPRSGQFQKGNKSVVEWNDTMAGSDNRLRLPALTLEHQVFSPFKSICTLNIFQYGENAVIVSQKTGDALTIDIEVLRKQVLAFRIADGYNPKSKLASTEAIVGLMQLIMGSQVLQQQYGASLPGMVAHLAQLQGIRGLEEYDPNYKSTLVAPAGLPNINVPAETPPAPAQIDPAMQMPAAPMPNNTSGIV